MLFQIVLDRFLRYLNDFFFFFVVHKNSFINPVSEDPISLHPQLLKGWAWVREKPGEGCGMSPISQHREMKGERGRGAVQIGVYVWQGERVDY